MIKNNMISLFIVFVSSLTMFQCQSSTTEKITHSNTEVTENQTVMDIVDKEVSPLLTENNVDINTQLSNNNEPESKKEDQTEGIKQDHSEDEVSTTIVSPPVENIDNTQSVNDEHSQGGIIEVVDQKDLNSNGIKDPKEAVTEVVDLSADEELKSNKTIVLPKVNNEELPVKQEGKNIEQTTDSETFNHDSWDAILRANVSDNGRVNYAGIKSSIQDLNKYLGFLSDNTPTSDWSANKTKAYWINVYNAFTIKLIVDNYPLGSIMDLHGGKPWDQKWIKLGGKTYSLNDVEHVILRPTYKDARIHFAVNCAAKSCPKVWNRAWTEQNVESSLDKLTRAFIRNTSANNITEGSVKLSKIFEWYGEDFGDLIPFLNKYSQTKISLNAKIAFNDYDWQLNS